MIMLKNYLKIYLKHISKLYKRIFRRKELQILKDFNHDCNEFYNKFMHERFLLSNNGIVFKLHYNITEHCFGIGISENRRIYNYFYPKNEVTAIYIETIVNKLLGHEPDSKN